MAYRSSFGFSVCLTAAFIIGGCASVPEQQAASDAPAPAVVSKVAEVEVENQDKPICKIQSVTGSNLTKKVCATESEWNRIRRESKEKTKWMQNKPGSLPTNGVAGG